MMPGVQVLQVVRELRTVGWTTPVLIVSGSSDRDLRHAAEQLDRVRFVEKPIDLDALVALARSSMEEGSDDPLYRGRQRGTDTVELRRRAERGTAPRMSHAEDLRALLGRTPRLYIAEDDDDTRQAYVELFREAGWEVHATGDGSKLLAEIGRGIVHKGGPDVILTDYRMPGFDGLTVMEGLRESRFEVPVVVVSGCAPVTVVRRLVRAGVSDYLRKPVDDVTLEGSVYAALAYTLSERQGLRL
jgi:FixJ family two-component response regulator